MLLDREMIHVQPAMRHRIPSQWGKYLDALEMLFKRGVEAGEFRVKNPKFVAYHILALTAGSRQRRWYVRNDYGLEQ